MEEKVSIWYSSHFWVILYAIVVTFMMCLQFVLGLLDNYEIVFASKTLNDFVNGNLNLPMTVLSYGWTALVSLYCGSDRVVDIFKTQKLSMGQTSMGDMPKLRFMILLSLFLFLTAVTFNFITDKDYDLSAWAAAFVMTIITYVTGNKLVKAASYFGKDDENKNGVPDEAEDSFKKWKRAQEKDGVEPGYITWDYFLDDPANIEWEKKYRPSSTSTIIKEKESDEKPKFPRPSHFGLLYKAEEINKSDEDLAVN